MTSFSVADRIDPSDIQRILRRCVLTSEGCWRWTGADNGSGYGVTFLSAPRRRRYVHRVLFQACIGPIPDGLEIHHICHDPDRCSPQKATDCPHRRCVNPIHLAAVTRRENNLAGGTWNRAHAEGRDCGFDGCKTCTYAGRRAAS